MTDDTDPNEQRKAILAFGALALGWFMSGTSGLMAYVTYEYGVSPIVDFNPLGITEAQAVFFSSASTLLFGSAILIGIGYHVKYNDFELFPKAEAA